MGFGLTINAYMEKEAWLHWCLASNCKHHYRKMKDKYCKFISTIETQLPTLEHLWGMAYR